MKKAGKTEIKGKNPKFDDKEKLTNTEDAFYRLSVEDCKKKIDRLEGHIENLDVFNQEIKQKILSLKEEKVDKAAELTKNVNSLENTIYEYTEEINSLRRKFDEIKEHDDETIKNLEDKYKAMHDQLTGEIKLLKTQLQMLEDFQSNRSELNFALEQEKNRMEQNSQAYKEVTAKMQLKIQEEKEALKKGIEVKLIETSEEFTRANVMRNAGYAQRLIRENIALEKEVYVLEGSRKTMSQQHKEHIDRYKEVKETFPALNRKKSELIFIAQEKTKRIEKLTTKYEKLRSAYIESLLYKNQYEDLIQYRLCKHQKRHQLISMGKDLASRAHMLKFECNYLKHNYERNDRELRRLRAVVQLLRTTILHAINVYEKSPGTHELKQYPEEEKVREEGEDKISRNEPLENFDSVETLTESKFEGQLTEHGKLKGSLLETLIDILDTLKAETSPATSVDTISANSFLYQYTDMLTQSSESLREAFKHTTESRVATVPSLLENLEAFHKDSKPRIPTERPERGLIFDVEKGSSLYVSSSKSALEPFVPPDEKDEIMQGSSSYDSDSDEDAETTPQSPPSEAVADELKQIHPKEDSTLAQVVPQDTIIDVEMVEEEEEDGEASEHFAYQTDNASLEEEEDMSAYMFY